MHGALAPGGGPIASGVTMPTTKHEIKLRMRAWELEFEARNGGLVPTHDDKKEDAEYRKLKAQAKRLEASMEKTRSATRTAKKPAALDGEAERKRRLEAGGSAELYATDDGTVGEESSYAFDSGRISLGPCHVLTLTLLVAAPCFVFCAAFSLVGFGAMIKDYLASNVGLYVPVAVVACALALQLYLFDVSTWKSASGVLARRLLLSAAGVCVVVGGLLSTKNYPYAPILLFFLLMPMYWWVLGRWLRSWPTPDFLLALSVALVLLSTCCAGIWIVWFSLGNNWNTENKRMYMLQMRCCTTAEELATELFEGGHTPTLLPASTAFGALHLLAPLPTTSMWGGIRWPSFANVSFVGTPALLNSSADVALLGGAALDEVGCLVTPKDPCMSALIFWVSPFVVAMAGYVASIIAFLLGRYLRAEDLSASGVSAGARVFLFGIVLSAASLWVAATVAGASMGMSRVVVLGTFIVVLLLAAMLNYLFGWKLLLTAIMAKEPLARRIIRFCVTSDWTKATLVAVGGVLLLFIVCLSALNQLVRVRVLKRVVLPAERAMATTKAVDGVLRRAALWNWTSVLRKVIVVCLAYLVLVIGVIKAVTLFMSWLMMMIKPLPLAVSTAIFVGVGMSMFLLPPVPGAPVYMASGVLLTAAAEETFGYWPACFYAMGVAYLIKLTACAMQQKLIGGLLKNSVAVREAVSVNSSLMRAIKLMMSEKARFSRGKVAVLVGGPDWPTSVLMGIMGLPLAPIVTGTLPVIALVAPLSLTGSFMIKGPTSPFPALNNLAIAASSLSQLGPMLLAMHYIEKASFEKRDALAALPIDEEVRARELAGEEYFALYSELTHWKSALVPNYMRALLIVGAVGASFSCLVATFFPKRCFLDFSLYPDYETQVREDLGGRWLNIVLPAGWGVLGLGLLFPFCCRAVFMCWADRLVRREFAAGRRPQRALSSRSLSRAASTAPAGEPLGRGNLVREMDEAGDGGSQASGSAGANPLEA